MATSTWQVSSQTAAPHPTHTQHPNLIRTSAHLRTLCACTLVLKHCFVVAALSYDHARLMRPDVVLRSPNQRTAEEISGRMEKICDLHNCSCTPVSYSNLDLHHAALICPAEGMMGFLAMRGFCPTSGGQSHTGQYTGKGCRRVTLCLFSVYAFNRSRGERSNSFHRGLLLDSS